MKCNLCGGASNCINSRPITMDDGSTQVKRRFKCRECGNRYSSIEVVVPEELVNNRKAKHWLKDMFSDEDKFVNFIAEVAEKHGLYLTLTSKPKIINHETIYKTKF